MRSFLNALLVLALLFTAFSSAKAQSLGTAQDYNVFLFGNHVQHGTDVEGRVAVGGNADYSGGGMTIASHLSSGAGTNLVVGGNLNNTYNTLNGSAIVGGTANWQGPTINGNLTANNVALGSYGTVNGNITYGNSITNPNTTVSGTTSQGAVAVPINFSSAQTFYNDLSTSLVGLTPTGTVTQSFGNLNLIGSGSSLEVFNLTAAQLGQANSFAFGSGFSSGSTVLINVSGSAVHASNFGFNLNGVDKTKILYNFSDANALTVSNIGWDGSILAPKATFVGNSGNLNGTLIANNFTGSMESHDYKFTGDLPKATSAPDASAILLTLMGLPFLGMALHRRQLSA